MRRLLCLYVAKPSTCCSPSEPPHCSADWRQRAAMASVTMDRGKLSSIICPCCSAPAVVAPSAAVAAASSPLRNTAGNDDRAKSFAATVVWRPIAPVGPCPPGVSEAELLLELPELPALKVRRCILERVSSLRKFSLCAASSDGRSAPSHHSRNSPSVIEPSPVCVCVSKRLHHAHTQYIQEAAVVNVRRNILSRIESR